MILFGKINLIFFALFFAFQSGAQSHSATTNQRQTIVIDMMKFNPDLVEVKVNQSITWMNNDLVPHTVTADSGEFKSGVINPGKHWKYKPKKKGSIAYHCSLHPTMKAVLNVD